MKARKFVKFVSATVGAGVAAGAVRAQTNAVTLEQLDQKVRIVARQLELAQEAAATKAVETPVLTAGKEGFALSSAGRAFELRLRGYGQADARFYLGTDKRAPADTFVLRRARVILEGALAREFEFRAAPDFGGGKAELQDAFLSYRPSEAVGVHIGRVKVPFGLERLQSSADTLFIETALSTGLTPNYDEGVVLSGTVAAGALEYAFGAVNGGPDGASVDADANDSKDLVGRLFLSPFRNGGPALMKGLGFGMAATFGQQDGSEAAPGLPSFRTPGQQSFFSYRASTNKAEVAFARGDRTRLAPQLYCTAGPFSLLGEYVVCEQTVANGSDADSVRNAGWQVAVSFVATGESPSLKGVKPFRPFNLANGGPGAVELAARYSSLNMDDAAFDGGYASRSKSASAAESMGLGVNWYLNRNVKCVLNYDRTAFTDGESRGDRADEKVVSFRAQFSF